jgi:RNA polymerase sigma-70 factor (ECF subfamily)
MTEPPPSEGDSAEHAERFTLLRPLLFTIAYEILGSATDADDVLQDGYLRWSAVDLSTVRDTRSYLAKLVTRQALNALRAGSRRREDYIGPWLPEPILTDEDDASRDLVLAESVSMAMLVVLEALSPDERAVFVLREVFGFEHRDIAAAVGKPVAAVRQTAHRARRHVHARRKRFAPADAAATARITEQFMAAAVTGDLAGLLALLSPDAVWTADSGGKATASRRPLVGAERIASLVIDLFDRNRLVPDLRFEVVACNGAPAIAASIAERPAGVFLLVTADGQVTDLYAIRNPDKLNAMSGIHRISRA